MTQAPTTDQMRAMWDSIAPYFDENLTPHTLHFGDTVLDRLDLRPGARLLDVGCGSGALAVPAARRGCSVTAVDLAPRMIDLLADRARSEGVTVEGRVMDAHALDLPDDAYDVAVSLNGVTMSPQVARPLAEMVRVTRPGGTVLVAAFGPLPQAGFLTTFVGAVRAAVPDFAGLPTDPPPPPFQLADRERFATVLRDAGLRDIQVETVDWEMPVRSGAHLWDEVTSSHPIGRQMTAGLSDAQRAEVLARLDAELRGRFGGHTEGVLTAAVNLGTGTV